MTDPTKPRHGAKPRNPKEVAYLLFETLMTAPLTAGEVLETLRVTNLVSLLHIQNHSTHPDLTGPLLVQGLRELADELAHTFEIQSDLKDTTDETHH